MKYRNVIMIFFFFCLRFHLIFWYVSRFYEFLKITFPRSFNPSFDYKLFEHFTVTSCIAFKSQVSESLRVELDKIAQRNAWRYRLMIVRCSVFARYFKMYLKSSKYRYKYLYKHWYTHFNRSWNQYVHFSYFCIIFSFIHTYAYNTYFPFLSIDRSYILRRWCVRDFQILSRCTPRIHTEKDLRMDTDVDVWEWTH